MIKNKEIILWGGFWRCFQICEFMKIAQNDIKGIVLDNVDEIDNSVEFRKELIISLDMMCEVVLSNENILVISCDMNPATEENKQQIAKNKGFFKKFVSNYDFHNNVELTFFCEHANQKYEISFEEKMARWMDSYLSEVSFWNDDVARPEGTYWNHYKDRTSEKDFYCERLLPYVQKNSIILDVGCGICSQYGDIYNGEKINISGVDPLAAFYNRINRRSFKEYELGENIPNVKFGMFELLSYQFDTEYADIIIIDNALDHCIDPVMAIIECLKVLKTGGLLSTFHHVDEAYKALYSDLHQWNISCDSEKNFIIWNQQNYINLSELLGEYVEFELVISDKIAIETPFGGVMCNMKKKKIIPSDYYIKDQKKRVGIILDIMMLKLSDLEYAEKLIDTMHAHTYSEKSSWMIVDKVKHLLKA